MVCVLVSTQDPGVEVEEEVEEGEGELGLEELRTEP